MSISLDKIKRLILPARGASRPVYIGLPGESMEDKDYRLIVKLAAMMEGCGWVLRTGYESVSQNPFEQGVVNNYSKSVYVPPSMLNRNQKASGCRYSYEKLDNWNEALGLAASRFPCRETIETDLLHVMASYHFLVLGPQLNRPADLVITCDRTGQGYIRWAVELAKESGVKVYNLAQNDTRAGFSRLIKEYSGVSGPH